MDFPGRKAAGFRECSMAGRFWLALLPGMLRGRDPAMSLRLTTRIIAPTILVSATLMLLGGVAAWYLHQLQKDSSHLLIASQTRLRAAEESKLVSFELQSQLYRFLFLPSRPIPRSLPRCVRNPRTGSRWHASSPIRRASEEWISQIERGYALLRPV